MFKYILIIFFISCCLYANDLEKKDKLFQKYLLENFEAKIPIEKHFYFVVSAIGCETCKYLDFDYLYKLLNRKNLKIIISYPNRMDLPERVSKIIQEENVWLDRGNYFKWNITPFTDGLIVTENNKVTNVYELERWTSDSVNKLLTQYEK